MRITAAAKNAAKPVNAIDLLSEVVVVLADPVKWAIGEVVGWGPVMLEMMILVLVFERWGEGRRAYNPVDAPVPTGGAVPDGPGAEGKGTRTPDGRGRGGMMVSESEEGKGTGIMVRASVGMGMLVMVEVKVMVIGAGQMGQVALLPAGAVPMGKLGAVGYRGRLMLGTGGRLG